jgi:hypothetical protein
MKNPKRPPRPRPQVKPLSLDKRGKLKLRESDVKQQITDFLWLHGWRIIRLNVVKGRIQGGGWIQQGEKGMPDLLAIKPFTVEVSPVTVYYKHHLDGFFVETKAKDGKPSSEQKAWQQEARRFGFTVLQSRSFEQFKQWYARQFR